MVNVILITATNNNNDVKIKPFSILSRFIFVLSSCNKSLYHIRCTFADSFCFVLFCSVCACARKISEATYGFQCNEKKLFWTCRCSHTDDTRIFVMWRQKTIALTFCTTSGVPKSFPPWRRSPQGCASTRLRRTFINCAISAIHNKKKKK